MKSLNNYIIERLLISKTRQTEQDIELTYDMFMDEFSKMNNPDIHLNRVFNTPDTVFKVQNGH